MRGRLAAAFVLALMAAGCLLLWIGAPIGALWFGSKLTTSFGPHLVISLVLSAVGMLIVAVGLVWMNQLYLRISGVAGRADVAGVRRGGPLEPMLFVCLVAAIAALVLWFLLLAENPTVNVY